jgi:predicted Ser/Thr protein kinase
MITALSELIVKHWSVYNIPTACDMAHLSFTKFCQRVVGRHTKVLFFVTYRGMPLCIIKTVRFPEFSVGLIREARAQQTALETVPLRVPRVLWQDECDGRAVYAEEYVDAAPVSIADYRSLETDIAAFSRALPHGGVVRVDEFIAQRMHLLAHDTVLNRHIATLAKSTVTLELGTTHGDLGRQNILGSRRGAWIIDWERSGDIPFRYIDVMAVVQDPAVCARLTGLTLEQAIALHAVHYLYMRLYKKYYVSYCALANSILKHEG